MKALRQFTLLLASSVVIGLFVLSGCSENSSGPTGSDANSLAGARGNSNTTVSTEVYGRVEAINPDARTMSLVGSGVSISIATDAEIVEKISSTETSIGLDKIYPGDSVDVRGNLVGQVLTADRVRKRANGPEAEFGGRVIFVDTVNSFVVLNTCWRVNVTAGTQIVVKNGGVETPILLSEIMINDSLDVKGYQNPDFSVTALRLRVRVAGDDEGEDADVEFTAVIDFIDSLAGSFTVAGRSELIVTDSNTRIFAKVRDRRQGGSSASDNGDSTRRMEEIPFSDLRVGFVVEVHADFAANNQLLAKRIELEDGFEDELEDDNEIEREFKSTIASIDAATRTITFSGTLGSGIVAADAELEGLQGQAVPFNHFAVGQLVEAKGFVVGDLFTITRLERDNN